MNLAHILPLEAVMPALDARDKKQVLRTMAAQAAALTSISEREIFSVLLDRELIGCTGMGNGVCVPHGRFEQLTKPLALFARLTKPIEFGAADGKRVDLVFMLMTPVSSSTDHLKALATISRLLRDKPLCGTIRKTADAAALHAMLVADRDDEVA